jgi:lysyl-tRNA synthetase class II
MEKLRLRVYKIEINDRGDPLRWPRDELYPQNLALTLPASGGRSVGIDRLRTKATEFSFLFLFVEADG